jgi:hypothetical protein
MRSSPAVLVLLVLIGLSPSWAADKDDAKKTDKAETPKVQRLNAVGTVRARITEINDNDLKLRISEKVPELLASRWGRSYSVSVNERTVETDLDVTMIEGVKVRLPIKPELDSKGRLKPPPKKDPKDPDRNLPGTKGTVKDLNEGQWITVTLAATKEKQPKLMAVMILVENREDY